MTEHRVFERDTVEGDAQQSDVLRDDYVSGASRGDNEAGGALAGVVAGAIVGAVAAGPVGAVVGGAIGATAGAVAAAVGDNAGDDTVVVTREVRTTSVPAR